MCFLQTLEVISIVRLCLTVFTDDAEAPNSTLASAANASWTGAASSCPLWSGSIDSRHKLASLHRNRRLAPI